MSRYQIQHPGSTTFTSIILRDEETPLLTSTNRAPYHEIQIHLLQKDNPGEDNRITLNATSAETVLSINAIFRTIGNFSIKISSLLENVFVKMVTIFNVLFLQLMTALLIFIACKHSQYNLILFLQVYVIITIFLVLVYFTKTTDKSVKLSHANQTFTVQRSSIWSQDLIYPLQEIVSFSAEKIPSDEDKELVRNPYFLVAHTTGDPISFGESHSCYEEIASRLNHFLRSIPDYTYKMDTVSHHLKDVDQIFSEDSDVEHKSSVRQPIVSLRETKNFFVWTTRKHINFVPVALLISVTLSFCTWICCIFLSLNLSVAGIDNVNSLGFLVSNISVVSGIFLFAIVYILIFRQLFLPNRIAFDKENGTLWSEVRKYLSPMLKVTYVGMDRVEHIQVSQQKEKPCIAYDIWGYRYFCSIPCSQYKFKLSTNVESEIDLEGLSKGEMNILYSLMKRNFPLVRTSIDLPEDLNS